VPLDGFEMQTADAMVCDSHPVPSTECRASCRGVVTAHRRTCRTLPDHPRCLLAHFDGWQCWGACWVELGRPSSCERRALPQSPAPAAEPSCARGGGGSASGDLWSRAARAVGPGGRPSPPHAPWPLDVAPPPRHRRAPSLARALRVVAALFLLLGSGNLSRRSRCGQGPVRVAARADLVHAATLGSTLAFRSTVVYNWGAEGSTRAGTAGP
jgi:hypothetical protein